MRSARLRRGREGGFTLIEVMISLAIAMIALVVLYDGTADGVHAAGATAAWRQAVSRARSRLDSITDPGRILGTHEGDDGGGYAWRTEVRLIAAAPPPPDARTGRWTRGTGLYAVCVTVSSRTVSYPLTTALLGPLPQAAP